MAEKYEWETRSLEWIHKVREEMDLEIVRKGLTPAQWLRTRGRTDTELLCRKLGLVNVTVSRDKAKVQSP